jgi:Domain of unknown function (DUF6429)
MAATETQGCICRSPVAPAAILNTMTRTGTRRRFAMAINTDKIDDTALALLYLTLHDHCRAWKGMDWDVLGRLHDKGMIDNPVGKNEIGGLHARRTGAGESAV